MSSISLARRVFMVFQATPAKVHPIGTAFGIAKPGLILTAHHVVKDIPAANLLVCCTAYSALLNVRVDRIVPHSDADAAVLLVNPDERLEHFEIGTPRDGFDEFPLGEDVLSYGFPPLEKPVKPRLMKGHIQSQFREREDGYDYRAFELAFPAFPGQSGSPVFGDWRRNSVMGIVTQYKSYTLTEKGAPQPSTAGYWAIGASITPLADWIQLIN